MPGAGPIVESPAWVAKVMWQHRVSEDACRLDRDLKTVQATERSRRCQLCAWSSLGTHCLDAHMRSDSHNMRVLRNRNMSLESMGGARGPRVQYFEGNLGKAWFNHLTGESGIVPSTN
jgi:hypothetical protein